MTITVDQAAGYVGQTLYGSDGKIGKIGQLYLDDESGQPEWVTVSTGLFGTKESFVPIASAAPAEDGLTVPYDKDTVKDAPRVDLDSDQHLSPDEESRLYRHYGFGDSSTGVTTTSTHGERTDGDRTDGDRTDGDRTDGDRTDGDERGVTDRIKDKVTADDDDDDTPRLRTDGTGDGSMTRSEERLNVGTEERVAGKARLRKYVETEQQQVEVPVRREKLRVETEPITDGTTGDAYDGPAITESEHEITLTEERPVVTTETVPVERVRVTKDVEESTETVEGEVRKERIDLDTDENTPHRN